MQAGGVRVLPKQFAATPKAMGVQNGTKTVMMSRWAGMDNDTSDDQMDIARGRGMVDSKFQGGFGLGGTQVSARTLFLQCLAAFALPRQIFLSEGGIGVEYSRLMRGGVCGV